MVWVVEEDVTTNKWYRAHHRDDDIDGEDTYS
jgi:hypothetical protein